MKNTTTVEKKVPKRTNSKKTKAVWHVNAFAKFSLISITHDEFRHKYIGGGTGAQGEKIPHFLVRGTTCKMPPLLKDVQEC